MRTNIVLNENLMQEASKYSSTKTKKALVEEALQTFVKVKAEERRRETYRDRLKQLQAKLRGIRLRTSPADILREDRDTR